MDVSPQLLREVEFREQWRGYNPDEVDDFLERVATALEQLQDRLRETADRAARAERQASQGGGGEDELKRTLVLAQRTADAAVQEATEEAARLRAEAEEQAGSLLAQARAQAEALVAEAEERASVELGELSERRQALEADVEALRAYVEEHRARMAADLRAQLEWLEGPERLALREPPAMQGVPVGDVEDDELLDDEDAFVDETAGPGDPLPGSEELADALRTFDGNGGNGQGHAAPRRLPPDEAEEDADEGPLAGAAADDPFLAELRRAVIDPEPLGPRGDGEDGEDEVFDQDMASARFRRRRRR